MDFNTAFRQLIDHEGGYSDDPRDPGNWTGGRVRNQDGSDRYVGELRGTKYGIAAHSYPTLDIRALTLDDAREIYRRDWWLAMRIDDLPDAIRFPAFDAAVNSGRTRSTLWLQRAAGVDDDGIIGDVTLAAVRALPASVVVARMTGHRLAFLADLGSWPVHGRGWSRRIASNLIATMD